MYLDPSEFPRWAVLCEQYLYGFNCHSFPTHTPNPRTFRSNKWSDKFSVDVKRKNSFRVIYYFSLKLNLFSFCTNQTACGCYTLQGITQNPKKV